VDQNGGATGPRPAGPGAPRSPPLGSPCRGWPAAGSRAASAASAVSAATASSSASICWCHAWRVSTKTSFCRGRKSFATRNRIIRWAGRGKGNLAFCRAPFPCRSCGTGETPHRHRRAVLSVRGLDLGLHRYAASRRRRRRPHPGSRCVGGLLTLSTGAGTPMGGETPSVTRGFCRMEGEFDRPGSVRRKKSDGTPW